jgi:methylaspartate ammonia-lyase
MSEDSAIAHFVSDPKRLVDLCRDVIDQLDSYTEATDIGEQQTQLREIAKTIERLERAGVSVPEVLRAEKTRLAASLAIHADARQALTHLADEFGDILRDLRSRLGLDQGSDGDRKEKRLSYV